MYFCTERSLCFPTLCVCALRNEPLVSIPTYTAPLLAAWKPQLDVTAGAPIIEWLWQREASPHDVCYLTAPGSISIQILLAENEPRFVRM
jgi:hypothetical protein